MNFRHPFDSRECLKFRLEKSVYYGCISRDTCLRELNLIIKPNRFCYRLFTVLYFSVRSSRSNALCYGLPSCMSVKRKETPAPSVHFKIKILVTVRRGISKRSHEKIGDCEQAIFVIMHQMKSFREKLVCVIVSPV